MVSEKTNKVFNKQLITFPKLERVTINGERFYVRPGVDANGSPITNTPYPSVTTVLASRSKDAIKEWRARVGEAEAKAITAKASRRGTKAHKLIEQFLMGEPLEESMPTALDMFLMFKNQAIAHIDNIMVIEGQMMSDSLRVAGTVDLIAEWDGELAVIDWKTSSRVKNREYAEGYFMQEAAYATMFEENTGIPVNKLITVFACETGESVVFEESRDEWIDKFIQYRKLFDINNPTLYSLEQ